MAGRYSGGATHKAAPGASRFGFRPSSGASRIPCPASTSARSDSPSAPIPGGALPQTKALLEARIRPQGIPKQCPARTPASLPRSMKCPSRTTPTKPICPCPPKASYSTQKSPAPSRAYSQRSQVVPCPAQSPRTPKSNV